MNLGKYQTELCNNREIPSATLRTALCNNWYFYYTRNTGDITSLDQPLSDGNGTLGDYMPDRSKSMEEIISDRMLLEQLFARLRELDPDADTIIQCWLDDYKISDRAIAEKLGRKQRTFADQMKKIRTELRKIRGY